MRKMRVKASQKPPPVSTLFDVLLQLVERGGCRGASHVESKAASVLGADRARPYVWGRKEGTAHVDER
jgi:hypothetical protein